MPTDSPKDAYKSVLEAMEDIPERLKPYCDRARPTVSDDYPYNATIQVVGMVPRKLCMITCPRMSRVTSEEATIMAKSLRKALEKILLVVLQSVTGLVRR